MNLYDSDGGGFQDSDFDWASSTASPHRVSSNPDPTAVISNTTHRQFINEEFLDDFEDDDDAFFASASSENNVFTGSLVAVEENVSSHEKSVKGGSMSSSFGMLTLTYSDVEAALSPSWATSSRGGIQRRPGSPVLSSLETVGDDKLGEDDDPDLLDLDKKCLIYLRNPHSSYRVVARSCLLIHQLLYSDDNTLNQTNQSSPLFSSSTTTIPIEIRSSSIYHIQRFQSLVHRIIFSLTKGLTSHNLPSCRSIMAQTLACTGRASFAKLNFDDRLKSVCLPPSVTTLLEDECGNGVAYSLVGAAIEDRDDAVSSSALAALGLLTLDPHCDNLSSEVRAITECTDPTTFLYEHDSKACWILKHSSVMKEIQSKVWRHILFPRMQRILHRMSLYCSHNHLAKSIPVVAAAFVHALTQGPETMPLRRAIISAKASHGKRGWIETDAVRLSKEFMEEILFPCLSHDGIGSSHNSKALYRAAAVACIRASSASPFAPWRIKACRYAVSTLMRQLCEETIIISNAYPAKSISENGVKICITTTLSNSTVSIDTLSGTTALLLIALRGIPLQERTPGLIAALRATLLFIPMAVPISRGIGEGHLDVPLSSVPGESCSISHRLGRIGLLNEVAMCVMVDGESDDNTIKIEEIHECTERDNNKIKVLGVRAIVLNQMFQSKYLVSFWESQLKKSDNISRVVDEIIWTFCSVFLLFEKHRDDTISSDVSLVVEWSNLGLVILDTFGKYLCTVSNTSPFSNAAHFAYVRLLALLLKRSSLLPPSTLSICDNMLPELPSINSDPITCSYKTRGQEYLSVVGGPGKQLPCVSSPLLMILKSMLIMWSKARHNNHQIGENTIFDIAKGALRACHVVDAWLGMCIINHDSKQSNEVELEMSATLLTFLRSEMNFFLTSLRLTVGNGFDKYMPFIDSDQSIFFIIIHIFRIFIACVESVANMSVLLWNVESIQTKGDVEALEDKCTSLGIAILSGIHNTAKEEIDTNAKTEPKKDEEHSLESSIFYQIALDASDATSRISEFSHSGRLSNYEDIVTSFKVPPLLSSPDCSKGRMLLKELFSMMLNLSINTVVSLNDSTSNGIFSSRAQSFSLISQLKPRDDCLAFLYHHARIYVSKRFTLRLSAPPFSSKRVHPINSLLLSSSFGHSTIEMYRRVQTLPLLIPASAVDRGDVVVSLTGCSDPVSLTMVYDIRRLRKANLSEEVMLVVTLRLYNITPVPIENGVHLTLIVTQNRLSHSGKRLYSASNAVSTAVYKGEIRGGEFITWEICFGNWKFGDTKLQASISFRDLEHEALTHKWLNGGDRDNDTSMINESVPFAADDDNEEMTDVTIVCEPFTLSFVSLLQPCPFVFFGGLSRCQCVLEGVGDIAVFNFLWSSMLWESYISFTASIKEMDAKKGCVILDRSDSGSSSVGCAFVTPDGNRIMCVSQNKGVDSHTLFIRSNSSYILQSIVEKSTSQLLFFEFLFGSDASTVQKAMSSLNIG